MCTTPAHTKNSWSRRCDFIELGVITYCVIKLKKSLDKNIRSILSIILKHFPCYARGNYGRPLPVDLRSDVLTKSKKLPALVAPLLNGFWGMANREND